MQFKHPEILYALLLLIIPILVHLFQLQRFKKVPFTNVYFLKKIVQQTRKSSRLKKYLILLTRMAAFTCLIIAFSQPYFSKNNIHNNVVTNIYLDNSYSMKAKGEQGELLKDITQKIIENTQEKNGSYSLFTNNNSFKNIDSKTLKNELINLQYATTPFNLSTVFLKINSQKNTSTNTLYKNIIISDFQEYNSENKIDVTNVNSVVNILKVAPKSIQNIFIDSIYISQENNSNININIVVKSNQNDAETTAISLFNDSKLLGKATLNFKNSNTAIANFTLPNTTILHGIVTIKDQYLDFDNTFYFTHAKPEKINVLSIEKNASFLNRIFTEKEFNFTSTLIQKLDYNFIKSQHVILLNELETIPAELTKLLKDFYENGGKIVIIPSTNSELNSYNYLFHHFTIGSILTKHEAAHKITTLVFEHPLLKNVFEKKVTNFQYPTTELYYKTQLKNSSTVIKLDTNEAFLSAFVNKNNGALYWFASPLNNDISNFTESPIVVPVFYNFATNNTTNFDLYHTIQPQNSIEIIASLGKDQVLKMANSETEFIPLQQISTNKASLKIDDNTLKSGFYTITSLNSTIKTLAFNYNRKECSLNNISLNDLTKNNKNLVINNTIDNFFNELHDAQKINWLFKWFLAFSVLFLLIEMLILKYFKT